LGEDYIVKDIGLAEGGRLKVETALQAMPVMRRLMEKYRESKPFQGLTVGACLHVTKETAVLMLTLREGGATPVLCASNPLSTQDEIAAYLASKGFHVYAFRGMSQHQYYWAIGMVLRHKPDLTVDDGADLTATIHKIALNRTDETVNIVTEASGHVDVERIVGGTEETTTGVLRLKALDSKGLLRYPVVAVNEAMSKGLFDNPLGTGQSAIDGIIRSLNILFAGKNVVVCGYGRVGSGIAARARGLGARVTVVEPNPIKALQAYMDGYYVTTIDEAASYGDIFITATGNIDVIRYEHFLKMKDGAVLANAGHMDVEINKEDLKKLAKTVERVRENVDLYRLADGRKLYLLGEGRLVNLVCAEGHPSEVMDLSFALQAESLRYLVVNKGKLDKKLYVVPQEIDEAVARMKLETLGVKTEALTPKQVEYLKTWLAGT